MEALYSRDFMLLWALFLALLLFLPVRNLIWILTVRRAQKKTGADLDVAEQKRLKRRASVTSALLCFVFSIGYISQVFPVAS